MLPASVKDFGSSFLLPEQTCHRLTLAQIQSGTNDFDEDLVIGSGGFGKVYKCPYKENEVVAIKRLDSKSKQGEDEFEAEVQVLSKLRHANLVSLIGYCNEEKERILAYEFMPNGTLKDHLHKDGPVLSWFQRLKICIGAARGLDYLHTGIATKHCVIHRDMKPSNILLDVNFEAKISDFGLAKVGPTNQTQTHVSTRVKGTYRFMDPCYLGSGKLTIKSDVYAFGVVLLEVLSGRPSVDLTLDEDPWSLASWAQSQMKVGKLNQIIDFRLKGQISKKSFKEFASIVVHCLHKQRKQRPSMAEVVVKLECILRQEKENTYPLVDEGTFFNKFKSFFEAKPDLMPLCAVESKSVTIAHHVKISSNQCLKIFTKAEIVNATNNFATLLETTFKGWVDEMTYSPTTVGSGLAIYVRITDIGTLKLKLEEINHPNLVKLLGYCVDNKKLFCVYELIPDSGLDKHLFRVASSTSLPWIVRLKVATGAAQGLSFLHRRKHIAYSQFKTSVILLDKNFNARLSYFEMDNSFLVQDSYAFHNDAYYAAPEWFNYQVGKVDGYTDTLSMSKEGFGVKSEIYAFGVVLLEILTGMKVYDVTRPLGKQNLVKWATPLLKDEANLVNIVDPQLQHNNNPPKGAFKLALLVSKCLQPIDEKRPTMEEICQVLHQCHRDESMKQNEYDS